MSRFFGKQSEDLVIDYLQSKGYQIVDRNFYAKKLGEIDIVALKDGVLHFIAKKTSVGQLED